jgi:tRNA(Ile)-lysidine synthase TilS/MesJ
MTDHLDLVSEVQAALALLERPERYWLAYSGGLDSRVLLDILLRLREQCRDFPPVHVVHVNHGLQDAADQWEQHCRALCDACDIPLLVHRWWSAKTVRARKPQPDGLGTALLSRHCSAATCCCSPIISMTRLKPCCSAC